MRIRKKARLELLYKLRFSMKGTRMTSGLLVLALSAIICIGYVSVNIRDDSEYQQHVKFNGEKDATKTIIIKKPMFPIRFNDGQIPIGSHCKVACTLGANKSYHIYLYGSWVNLGSDPKTDYDIFVYNLLGELDCNSTNAAGIPESIVTPGLEPYFVPNILESTFSSSPMMLKKATIPRERHL
ncbi:MAG: hypothetical protein QXK78_00765 [Candidatus Bathyarchaeia archaeon]